MFRLRKPFGSSGENSRVYVVDASVWVSRLLPVDVHHRPSYIWLEDRVAQGDLLLAPALLLAEVAGAVARRTGRPELGAQALQLLLQLPTFRLVPVDAQLAQRGAEMAAKQRLRGADALYVALAHELGLPLLTWDQEQHARGGAVVRVMTPQEALHP